MSMYATQEIIGIKRFGDKEFIEILVQGVPPHITETDRMYDFLPPPVDLDRTLLRAVVFVEAGDEKGTERSHQEYVKPLLTLSGQEYDQITFKDLIAKLNDALDRKYKFRISQI